MVFLISYDLNKSDKDYDGVIKAIKDASTGAWCRPVKSTWIIKSNYTLATDVYEAIRNNFDANDRFIVIEVTENKQGWLDKKDWEYINNSIFG